MCLGGFSWFGRSRLYDYAKLSLASSIMLCLNIQGWDAMISFGFNAAISVRVSNELGAGNARAAKFSVVVVSITTVFIGVVGMVAVIAAKDVFPYLFTNSEAVAKETTRLSILLAVTVLLNGLQPVLS
ncbi:UNVERIFIED_CONTAM: protein DETOXIFICATION 33, partial [Sesamum radiatum]